MERLEDIPTLVRDIRHAIDHDKWIWGIIWGDPRTGKSTLALTIAYRIYKDWDKVLDCIGFNLSQIIYKIKKGIPETWPTINGLHDRVPLLVWDDFGATANRAVTQHDMSFDYFKAAFDVLGTKLGVLLGTMVAPSAPTAQLSEKINAEIWIPKRGSYKYDRVRSQQDFSGWRPRSTKEWLDSQEFETIPEEVFREYDEMRMSLADESIQKLEDIMADTHLDGLLKRVQSLDVDILYHIKTVGPRKGQEIYENFGEKARNACMRLRARQLMTPVKMGHKYYRYDLTDLGLQLLDALEQKRQEKKVSTVSTT